MAARRVVAVPGPRGVAGPFGNAGAARGLVAVRRGEPVARPDLRGNHLFVALLLGRSLSTWLPPRHRSDAVASMAWNLDAVEQTQS